MPTVTLFLSQPYKKNTKGAGKVLKAKETRIYLGINIDRLRVIKLRSPYSILPREWDFKKQIRKEILTGSPEFNGKLQNLRKEILDKYFETIKKFPDHDDRAVCAVLKEYISMKEKPHQSDDSGFFKVLDDFIVFLEGEVAPGTVKKFNTLKKSLTAFRSDNPAYQNLNFAAIDHKFRDTYTNYLRNQAPRGRQKTRPEGEQKGLLNDTVGKYIECLKTFCKWAEERGYNRYSLYAQFPNFTKANRKRKKQDHDIVTLTLVELKKLYHYDFLDKPHLDRVRDLFCFAAFTGQRWSDISRFEKNQIKGDTWIFVADKTKKETEIDLIGYAAPAKNILQKYNYELPKMTLKNMNDYIKEAAEKAGINAPTKIRRYVGAKEITISNPKFKFIGSHTARRTCVSLLLNEYNLNVVHVMEITGHNDLKTLMKYINKDRNARREAIGKTKSILEIMTAKRNEAI